MSEPEPNGPVVSVVVPCFEEEEALPGFLDRLLPVLDGMEQSFEVLLVDDGSSDGTFELIRRRAIDRPELRALRLSRNFGHQQALTAGLDAARGQAVVTMDADLQHPPELLPEMVSSWRAGAQVVLTERCDQGRTGVLKRLTSWIFYRLLSLLSPVRIEPGSSDFRLVDRRVVEALGRCREVHRMLRGLSLWVGFRRATLPYEVGERVAGTSKYTLRRMIAFALDGILSFSIVPLRAAIFLGLGAALLASLYLAYVLAIWFLRPDAVVHGWASTVGVVLLQGGIQLVFLGILGEYLGRTFEQVKGRPLYLVAERLPDDPSP